jgi:L-alanine-DL-glutamate epimerase-like enolase superfamily enzyme
MKILDIQAFPISFKIPEGKGVRLGIGLAVKRDAVLIKVTTDEGLIGWGEAHHGRCPGAIAKLVDTTFKELIVGMDPLSNINIWEKIYRMQLSSHGMGYASTMALSGLDIALWDIKGKYFNAPVYKLLGGSKNKIPSYAGGIALGWQEPESLAEEALSHISEGYNAIKLRVGDKIKKDLERVEKVRKIIPENIEILVDANTNYSLKDAQKAIPFYEDLQITWLEEPFPAMEFNNYRTAKSFGNLSFAAGENHFTRYEFSRLIEDNVINYAQPDVSKTGGVTELIRIANLMSGWNVSINPHTSLTGINMAASIHCLASIDNGGFFEGDVTSFNPFRDDMSEIPFELDKDGSVSPSELPGIGIDIDERFLKKYPLIDGPCYV